MNNRILLVDDEINLLQSLRRSLRGRYDVTLAEGGPAALELLKSGEEFAVIVSDMQMPELDGVTLLKHAREIFPDTVRMMLTGNVDQETAVNAVNCGAIFRFLNKPCTTENLAAALDEGLRQYSLINAEKQLLSQTLTGSVVMITELIAISNPIAFGRGGRLRGLARRVAEHMQWPDVWQYEVAAMLSQVGSVGSQGEKGVSSQQTLKNQAELSRSLVGRIPRLERIASMIGSQYQVDGLSELTVPERNGAQLLRIIIDFDLIQASNSFSATIHQMEAGVGKIYDPTIFNGFTEVLLGDMELAALPVRELVPRMILEENVVNRNGDILISKDHELTESLIQRLVSFSRNSVGVREPIQVRIPPGCKTPAKADAD